MLAMLARVLSRKFLLGGGGGGLSCMHGLYGRSAKDLQRVHGEMYNRPISYQNALFEFLVVTKLTAREKVSVH